MVEGEVTQLTRERCISNREDYFQWIDAKTAALFELAAGAPALLCSAGQDAFLAACQFGRGIGMAFQIVDDVLDFTGGVTQLGKPVGNDLRQGVVTLPALIYFENHPDMGGLDALLYNGHLKASTLMELMERIRSSAAIGQALKTAHDFIQVALEGLAYLPDGPERFALYEIAQNIVEQGK